MLDVHVTTDPQKLHHLDRASREILSSELYRPKLVKQGTVPPSLRSTSVVAL